MDILKTKFNLKSTKQLAIIGLTLVATLVTIYVAYTAASRRNISLQNPAGRPGAFNASCQLSLTLYRPTPSPSPLPSPTSTPLVCNSTCTTNLNCSGGMVCSAGYCRNPSCVNQTSCLCATPSPGQPGLSASCSGTTPIVNISWSGITPENWGGGYYGYTVIIYDYPLNGNSYTKDVSTTSTNSIGFVGAANTPVAGQTLVLVPGKLYVAAIWNGTQNPYSNTFTVNSCTTGPTPPPTLQCGSTCPNQGNNCASGMTCVNGLCRNPSCTGSTSCICSTPTPTPNNVCRVSFDLPDTTVCWTNPIYGLPITYTVQSLPTTGGPFHMQTDWYVASPYGGLNHYEQSQTIIAGQKYTMYADWPGILSSQQITEIHAGINVVDANGNILNPACTDGLDYYWTPYVACPGGPTAPTGTATVLSSIEDAYVNGNSNTVATNYGSSSTLTIKSSPYQAAYLKFDLTSLANKVVNASRLYVKVAGGTTGTQKVKSTATNWSEGIINYNNRPAVLSTITTSGASVVNSWKEIDLTTFVNANKGKVVSIMLDSLSTDDLIVNSRESASGRPVLVVQ